MKLKLIEFLTYGTLLIRKISRSVVVDNQNDIANRYIVAIATGIYVTGPAKTGHICTKYTCSENHTYLGHYLW